MSDREMSQGFNSNEIMSFKYHYVSCVVGELIKIEQHVIQTEDLTNIDSVIEYQIKRFLMCNIQTAVCEYQELYLKDVIRNFKYKQSAILSQMVATLTGSESPPTALSVILAAINGQKGFGDSDSCETCGEEKAPKKCSKCKSVQYCNQECQRLHWFMHKKLCGTDTKTKLDLNAKKTPGFKAQDNPTFQDQVKLHF